MDHDPPPLSIDVETVGDDLVVVAVRGDLDLKEAGELRAVLNDACTGPHTNVAVDLKAVHFVSSSGMGVLADAHQRMTEQGRRLVVLDPSEAIRQAFEMAGVAHVFES